MTIICTAQERDNIIDAFNAWCPFDIECPYRKYGYRCNKCILERVEFEIKENKE